MRIPRLLLMELDDSQILADPEPMLDSQEEK
jgi:hypothetical protein